MSKHVDITVNEVGEVEINVVGYAGTTCREATAAFEGAMRDTARERQMVGEGGPPKDYGENVIR